MSVVTRSATSGLGGASSALTPESCGASGPISRPSYTPCCISGSRSADRAAQRVEVEQHADVAELQACVDYRDGLLELGRGYGAC